MVEQVCAFLEKENEPECQYAAIYVLLRLDIAVASRFLESFLTNFQNLEEFLQLIVIDYLRRMATGNEGGSDPENLNFHFVRRLLNETPFDSVKFEIIVMILNSYISDRQIISNLLSILLGILIKENNLLCQVLILKILDKFSEKVSNNSNTLCIEFLSLLSNQHYRIKNLAICCSLKTFNPISSREVLKKISEYLSKSEFVTEDKLFASHLLEICKFVFEIFKRVSDHSLVIYSIRDILLPLLKKIRMENKEIVNEVLLTMKNILFITSFTNVSEIALIEFLDENLIILLNPKFLSIILWMLGESVSNVGDFLVVQKVIDGVKKLLVSFSSKMEQSSQTSITDATGTTLNRLHLYYLSLFFLKLLSIYSSTVEVDLFNKIKAESLILICDLFKSIEESRETKYGSSHRDLYDQIIQNIKLIVSVNEHSQIDFDFDAIISKDSKNHSKEMSEAIISFGILKKMNQEFSKKDKLEENLALSKEDSLISKSDCDKFKNIMQLSGSSDPIYVEAFISIIKIDVSIDCLLVNQTEETFYNLNLEFMPTGSMRMIESPKSITLLPHGFSFLKAVVRIPSGDSLSNINGIISYSLNTHNKNTECVEDIITLSPISPSIKNFMELQSNRSVNFPQLWTLLEWENKIDVPVNSRFGNLNQVLEYLSQNANIKNTNSGRFEDQDYIACNFVGSSVFGDDILVNVCLEKVTAGITGQIRLRSQSESIALIMGDYIQSLLL